MPVEDADRQDTLGQATGDRRQATVGALLLSPTAYRLPPIAYLGGGAWRLP